MGDDSDESLEYTEFELVLFLKTIHKYKKKFSKASHQPNHSIRIVVLGTVLQAVADQPIYRFDKKSNSNMTMKTNTLSCYFTAIGCSCMLAISAGAATILNSSFELPDIPATGYTDQAPSNWVVSEPEGGFQQSMFERSDFPGVDGGQFVAFNAGGTASGASIHQSFATITGASYEVSFWVTGNFSPGVSIDATIFDGVDMTGTQLATQTGAASGSIVSWQNHTVAFTANSVTTTLAFIDSSTLISDRDAFLDHVEITLTAVPEPAGTTFLGLSVLCFILRRKRYL